MSLTRASLAAILIVGCGNYRRTLVVEDGSVFLEDSVAKQLVGTHVYLDTYEGPVEGKVKKAGDKRLLVAMESGPYVDYEWTLPVEKVRSAKVTMQETSVKRTTTGCFIGVFPGFALTAVGIFTAPKADTSSVEGAQTPFLVLVGVPLIVAGGLGGAIYGGFKDYVVSKRLIDAKYDFLASLVAAQAVADSAADGR